MFHISGWTQSVDTAGVLTLHAAILESQIRTQGNDIVVPDALPNVILAYAGGANITRAQLQSPSLRQMLNPEVVPIDVAAAPSTPPLLADWRDSPLGLAKGEFLDFAAAENAAGAARQNGFVWLADGPVKLDARPFFTIRATSATALVAFAWTPCNLTFDQTLAAGTYDIVGARCRSATGLAFRFVFPEYSWRPGALCFVGANAYDEPWFRSGQMGVWGTFKHNAPPTVEMLASAADAAETLEIDLVKTG